MTSIASVTILTHPKRFDEALAFSKLVNLQAEPLGIPVNISQDGGWHHPRGTVMQALRFKANGHGWRLLLHDDLLIPKGALAKLESILPHLPSDSFVSAYCPANKGYDAAFEGGHHILRTATNLWCQAILYPEAHVGPLLEYDRDVIDPDYRYDDRLLAAYLISIRAKMLCIVPSLFQHLGAYRSTLGFPGKAGGRFRFSDCFDPDFDPATVDWEAEVEAPFDHENRLITEGLFRHE